MKNGNLHRLRPFLLTAVFAAAPPLDAATYTVTNTNDSGAGSLRDAITQSNASVGVTDTIAFNVTGTGCVGSPAVCTIQPTSPLPNLTDPVTIDGYTQPGSSPNSLAVGDNALLLIEIDGSHIGVFSYGLLIFTDNTVIQGLVINRFNDPGIGIDTSGGGANGGHVIRGNFIGTNPAWDRRCAQLRVRHLHSLPEQSSRRPESLRPQRHRRRLGRVRDRNPVRRQTPALRRTETSSRATTSAPTSPAHVRSGAPTACTSAPEAASRSAGPAPERATSSPETPATAST